MSLFCFVYMCEDHHKIGRLMARTFSRTCFFLHSMSEILSSRRIYFIFCFICDYCMLLSNNAAFKLVLSSSQWTWALYNLGVEAPLNPNTHRHTSQWTHDRQPGHPSFDSGYTRYLHMYCILSMPNLWQLCTSCC